MMTKNNKKIHRIKFALLAVVIACFLSFARGSLAASVFFDTTKNPVVAGDNIDVAVSADTAGNSINAVELAVDYDENLLSFSGYSDEGAVIKLWIVPPYAEEGKIYMSGIVPGGVTGLYDPNNKENRLGAIPLAHLLFKTINAGNANFSFTDSKILQNDGLGTPLVHSVKNASILIEKNPNKEKGVSLKPESANDVEIERRKWKVAMVMIAFLLALNILTYKLLKYIKKP